MKKLKKVTIGKNVEWIQDKAFAGCPKLTTVTFASGAALDEIGTGAFSSCKSLKAITIPKKVMMICKKAFSGDKKLAKITVKSTQIQVVGKSAFKGIAAKAVIKVPKSKIGAYKTGDLRGKPPRDHPYAFLDGNPPPEWMNGY